MKNLSRIQKNISMHIGYKGRINVILLYYSIINIMKMLIEKIKKIVYLDMKSKDFIIITEYYRRKGVS